MKPVGIIFSGAAWILAAMAAFAVKSTNAPLKKESPVHTVTIVSSMDRSEQKALFYLPPGSAHDQKGEPIPLLVQLHTWSGNYTQCDAYPRDKKWGMIAPDFRGPNNRPEACASLLAIQDVLDAVEYAKKNARIDESRIYLSGWSGGGHMALMMAAKAPNIWAGISSWVPISDLAAWHAFQKSSGYGRQMVQVCGGAPGTPAADAEYKARSPINFLPSARDIPFDINAGIHDGHTGSVPISQSLYAFNVLAEANGFKDRQITEADIRQMTREAKVPPTLARETENDPERTLAILFRRTAGSVRITLFEGGHAVEKDAAWNWLERQKKGALAFFEVPKSSDGIKIPASGAQDVAR
ncbi:MAG: prolyl oligopeptidase family serine peptidase [Kiritimatiellae bacterium]|nr:prolyl oligopeptidase family serine peptidase [Kiritimatiellia bacterium]